MRKNWILSAILCTSVTASAPVFAGQGFSADMVTHTGAQDMPGKIYAEDNKSRVEIAGTVMITRMDKNVAYIVMTGQGMYMERAIDPKAALSQSKEVPGELKRVSKGKEAVNGVDAEKFEITYKSPQGEALTLYQWIAPGAPVPARIAAGDDSWSVDYTNVHAGDQDDALFEVPEGCQKMQIPSMADIGAMQD